MKYNRPWRHGSPWHYSSFRPYQLHTGKLNLKLEDKILLGIGGIFLVGVFFFMSFMGKVFDVLDHHSGKPATLSTVQEPSAVEEEIEDSFEKSFRESEAAFQRFQEVFEENSRKSDENFKKAQQNFEKRFKEAEANFKKGVWIDKIHKEVEEAGERARREAFKKNPNLINLNP